MKTKTVNCRQCGATMKRTKKAESNLALQAFGLLCFFAGFGLMILFPLGTIGGIILVIASARIGYTRRKVWLCPGCGNFFERA